MKKMLLFLLLLNVVTANSQIEKGKWIGSATVNGRNYKSVSDYQGSYDGFYKENLITTNVIINKVLKKNYMIGMGINYYRQMNSSYHSNPVYDPSFSYKKTIQSVGPILQAGYWKQLDDNFYYGFILQTGYNFLSYKDKSQYMKPNEYLISYNGYEFYTKVNPLKLGYLFKSKFLIALNIVSLDYKYKNDDPNSQYKSPSNDFTYSFNPFQNGVSFYYLIKN